MAWQGTMRYARMFLFLGEQFIGMSRVRLNASFLKHAFNALNGLLDFGGRSQ
jgi:hypothetical protein